jgi:hypothetical protein
VTAKLERLPDILRLQAGSLDDPSIYRPMMDVFTFSAQPWDHMESRGANAYARPAAVICRPFPASPVEKGRQRMTVSGTPRGFAAVRKFGRDRSKADMPRAWERIDLTKMTHT